MSTATEADWSFYAPGSDILTACEIAARRAVREFEAVEYDDALQDALLYVAVRPELQAAWRNGRYDGIAELASNLYANALRDGALRGADKGITNVPLAKRGAVGTGLVEEGLEVAQ